MFTIGIEEEFQIVDIATGELCPHAKSIIKAGKKNLNERLKEEVHQSTIETNSKVFDNPADLIKSVRSDRKVLRELSSQVGSSILCSGTTLISSHWTQLISENDHFQDIVRRYPFSVDECIYGLHVHIGGLSWHSIIEMTPRFAYFLPQLIALSASSPFYEGHISGVSSSRLLLYKKIPNTGLPPRYSTVREFEKLVEHLKNNGYIRSCNEIWWFVRPGFKHKTLEIRICDATPNMESVEAICAYIMCQVAYLQANHLFGSDYDRVTASYNFDAAVIGGLEAKIYSPVHESFLPIADVIKKDMQTLEAAAKKLNIKESLAKLNRVLERGNTSKQLISKFKSPRNLMATKYLVEETNAN